MVSLLQATHISAIFPEKAGAPPRSSHWLKSLKTIRSHVILRCQKPCHVLKEVLGKMAAQASV